MQPVWTTGVHNQIVRSAFQGILTPQQIQIIETTSRLFDRETQAPSEAYKHAMSPPGAGPATGEFLYKQFVENRLNEAIRLEREALPDLALQTLAEGMHAIMDSTAPAHKGFQVWDGIDASIARHLAYDTLIMPWERKATATMLREYYNRFRQGVAERP